MSLSNFHIVLISFAEFLAFALGIWGARYYSNSGDVNYLWMSILCFVLAIGFCIYFIWFIRVGKSRLKEE